jgi:hypothetical protein
MRTRILLVVALAISLVAIPVATGQAGTRARNLDVSIRMAAIDPAPGVTFAGDARSRLTGRSAVVIDTVADGGEVVGKGVLYTARGLIRANTRNTVEPQADGSVRIVGTFKITGGTRRFRGATGSGTFTGVLPANSTVYEIDLDGKIRY